MTNTPDIYQLLQVQDQLRDQKWEDSFLKALPKAKLSLISETPVAGPDGWPYLMANVDEKGSEPADRVMGWLSDKGIGLVLNPNGQTPDFVFSYGMLWNFRERQEFITQDKMQFEDDLKSRNPKADSLVFESGQKVLAGPPSKEYLPDYVRGIIRSFLKENGFSAIKILVISPDQKNFDLCFSLESMGSPKEEERTSFLEALSWFLPSHYSLAVVSEVGMPSFHNL